MKTSTTCQLAFASVHPPEQAAACYALRANQYGRYYRNIPVAEFTDEFDVAVGEDGNPVSRLFGVAREDSIVGTCRLIRTLDPKQRSLESEVQTLFDLTWNHVAETVGIPKSELCVGELGKFSVVEEDDSRAIKRMLLSGSGKHALDNGMQVVIAIMPLTVERAARQAGVFFARLESVQLRRDDTTRKKFLLRYHDYFLPMFRKLGLDIDVDHIERVSPNVLDMLLSGASDGPVLWWIRSKELANP